MRRMIGIATLFTLLALAGCSSKPAPQIVKLDDLECQAVADTPEEAFEACRDARENLESNLQRQTKNRVQ